MRNPFAAYGGVWSNFRPQGQFQEWAQLMANLELPGGGNGTADAPDETGSGGLRGVTRARTDVGQATKLLCFASLICAEYS